MINWKRRKQSEDWAKRKSIEFCKANSDLTFAEWCYQQGKTEAKANMIEECKYLLACGMGKKKSLEHLIRILEKEQK